MPIAPSVPVLARSLVVRPSVDSSTLLRLLARDSLLLAQRARREGRTAGEVEVECVGPTEYLLTWKDASTVSAELKREYPVNVPLSAGGGSYLSPETIHGVKVKMLRDCATQTLMDAEVKEVLEYRLKCINEAIVADIAQSDAEVAKGLMGGLSVTLPLLRDEYAWLLKLIAGPQHT